MALSVEDIDKELKAREGSENSVVDEIDEELKRRGVQPDSAAASEKTSPVDMIKDIAGRALKAASPGLATVGEIAMNPEFQKKSQEISSMPMRGLRGLGVTATSGLQRGAEAVKPGFDPEGIPENVASVGAEMLDPRLLAINPAVGMAGKAALKAGAPVAKFLGEQGARGIQAFTGTPAADVMMTAKQPAKVLFSKLQNTAGKLFQAAKEKVGVTEAEERLTAGIGDPSGFKRVADKFQRKFESKGAESITPGEALAWKKAAGELSRKAKGSARKIYGADAATAQEILKAKAPEVAKTQADVALSKARGAFMSILPRNQGGSPAVLRTMLAGGTAYQGSRGDSKFGPLAALAFSPLLAGLPLTLGVAGASKLAGGAAKAAANNPAIRQALLAALAKINGGNE